MSGHVKLFEEVKWELELPCYSAIAHLLNDDFMFEWTPMCTRQYDAIMELTGVVHVSTEAATAAAEVPDPLSIGACTDNPNRL